VRPAVRGIAAAAAEDPSAARRERVVLISPMIGITRFARPAGIGRPAILSAIAKAAWLSVPPGLNRLDHNFPPIHERARPASPCWRLRTRRRDGRRSRAGT